MKVLQLSIDPDHVSNEAYFQPNLHLEKTVNIASRLFQGQVNVWNLKQIFRFS